MWQDNTLLILFPPDPLAVHKVITSGCCSGVVIIWTLEADLETTVADTFVN